MRHAVIASRDLWLAAGVSLCIHAGLGGVLAVTRVNRPGAVAAAISPVEPAVEISVPEEPEESVRLGMEQSAAETDSWLGAEAETEHEAPKSEIEQAALTLAPAAQPGDTPPVEAAAAPPIEPVRPTPAEVQAAMSMVLAARAALEAIADAAGAAARAAVEPAFADGGSRPLAPPAAGTPAPAPARDAPGGGPGILSDKEAVAAALRDAPAVVPGRVFAAKGLEISTRRPRWSKTTLATASPRNPVVRITFGRDGRVRRAEFVQLDRAVLSTGYVDVDEPLMNAIYRWTAKGEALARVPENDPEAGVAIIVRVILVG